MPPFFLRSPRRATRSVLAVPLAVSLAVLVAAGCSEPVDSGGATATPTTQADRQPPAFVTGMETAPVAASSPDGNAAAWALAFIDVETTGLVPGWHEMIDLGVVMTDLEGRPLDSLFVRIQPQFPDRTSEGARAVNAFNPDRWREAGALSPAAAVDTLRAFQRRTADGRDVLLVAFNSQFDTAFLDHLFRGRGASWRELYHYFVLDIPSMAWAMGLRGLTGSSLSRELGVADEPHVAEDHTGLTGARLNARLYRALEARQVQRASGTLPEDAPATVAPAGSENR